MEPTIEYPTAVTAFYFFAPLSAATLQALERDLYALAESKGGLGLVVVAPDGWNGTVAGSVEFIAGIKGLVTPFAQLAATEFKDSGARKNPFRRFKVDQRETIIDMGVPGFVPEGPKRTHLSPTQWHTKLQDSNATVLDVRNRYEWEIGKFQGAITPPIEKFNEFAKYLAEANIPKEKPIMMYCTGGVRCEKASLLMEEMGYREIYQLDGGILRYLEQYPQGSFEGECFVFDNRVAVGAGVHPTSRFGLCPHCGNAGDIRINCARCQEPAIICSHCHQEPLRHSCSKDCRHHLSKSGSTRTIEKCSARTK